MEELLNKLIEKGWKIFGRNYCKYKNGCLYYIVHTEDGVWSEGRYGVSLRELVSKESGLWQFVCDREHRFIDLSYQDDKRLKNPYANYNGVDTEYEWITGLDYQYRLIESALKDESELEQFLLDNIKIDE